MTRRLLLVLLFLAVAPSPAAATQVYHVPLDQMTRESEVIIRARVVGQRVRWDETRSRILTLTDLEVIEAVKGAEPHEAITIYQVGGTLDGVTFRVPGALTFVRDEEIFFFAARHRDWIVSYGMGLGKYVVRYQEGVPFIEPQLGDVSFVAHTPDGWVPATPPPHFTRPLAELLAEIRRVLVEESGATP